MKAPKKIAFSLAFVATLFPSVGIATASNIKVVSFSKASAPVTIEVADGKAHLIDFSGSNANITGIFVDDAQEFSKSFRIEPVPNNPQMITFTGVKGGSSKFTANIIQTDDEGKQYIQPIRLVKRWSGNTITRISDKDAIAEEESNSTEVAALERGYQVISQNPDVDPELKARIGELVEAARNGEDLDQAASDIGVSQSMTQQLMAMGSTSTVQPKYTDRRLAQ
jgi:hypothetical protein